MVLNRKEEIMMEWRAFLLVVHLVSTLLMAAPFYMLVIFNERAYFGAPMGYFIDRYMENIIRNSAAFYGRETSRFPIPRNGAFGTISALLR
jgi:hypothetical protein